MVRVLLRARRPGEVHVADLGGNDRQVVVEVGILQMHGHSSIIDGIDLHGESAE